MGGTFVLFVTWFSIISNFIKNDDHQVKGFILYFLKNLVGLSHSCFIRFVKIYICRLNQSDQNKLSFSIFYYLFFIVRDCHILMRVKQVRMLWDFLFWKSTALKWQTQFENILFLNFSPTVTPIGSCLAFYNIIS